VAQQHGTPNWGLKRGWVLTEGTSPTVMCGRPEGNGGGGDGRRLAVREGGTWQCGARGGNRGLGGGGTTQWLDDGRTRRRSGGDEREEERLFTGGGVGLPL
jgi:hypothetical protein